MNRKILIIDDEQLMREFLAETLTRSNYRVVCAKDGAEGLKEITTDSFDLIITDIKMPEMNGIELIQQVRKIDKNMPIIVCTAFQYMKDDYELVNANLAAYVTKPFKNDQFRELVKNILARAAV